MLRCDTCGKKFHADFPEFVWNDWLKLADFLDFLRTEEDITNATYEVLLNALLTFKPDVPEIEEG